MRKQLHLLLFVFLASVTSMQAQTYPTTEWADLADTSWFDAELDEFSITTPEALAGLAELVNDGNTFEDKTITIDEAIDLDGNLWTPIGIDIPIPFSGTVEGNDNTISNLWIDLPNQSVAGLFGQVTGGTLSNIIIDISHIVAADTAGSLVGNLSTESSVINSHATNANITCSGYNCGGLVGGLLTDSSVSNSSAIGEITGESQIGGLVGSAWDKTDITNSYSEGNITADYLAGGLVGYCTMAFAPYRTNAVNNSYSRANVTVILGRAGGLYGGADSDLLITNSYSTGTVYAPEFEGGFIGAFGGGSIDIENTYFDTESSELTEAVGGFTGPTQTYDIEGKTTAEMKSQAVVDLLNTGSNDNPWTLDANENDGYPILDQTLSTTHPKEIKLALDIYPTVVDSQINVSSELELEAFRIYNYSGQMVSEGNLKHNKTINANGLSAGTYLLNISTTEGTVTKKFIKK